MTERDGSSSPSGTRADVDPTQAHLQELCDRQLIQDVILTYCRGIDRMERDLVINCFHDDAYDEHGNFEGTVDQFIAWVWPLLEKYSSTMHLVGNHLCEIRGNAAVAETYGVAIHRSDDPAPHRNLDVGFRYIDRFERRDGEWRIAHRIATTEWAETADAARLWEVPEGMRVGVRGMSDSIFQFLDELHPG